MVFWKAKIRFLTKMNRDERAESIFQQGFIPKPVLSGLGVHKNGCVRGDGLPVYGRFARHGEKVFSRISIYF